MLMIKNLTRTHTQVLLAIFITMLIAWVAIHESQTYYNVGSFHYDSAGYINSALEDYNSIHEHGRLFSLIQSLKARDSLDITLRILFAPYMLKSIYGHMIISLPFIALFIFLIFNYVFKRTQSWLSSIIAAIFIFVFPIVYNPYMGIADYWKESVAIWILGSAFMSWLLSDLLNKPRWSALSGILLGLLVMERAALSIYIAQLFLPLFAYACYTRLVIDKQKSFSSINRLQRQDACSDNNFSEKFSRKQALKKIAIFAMPALFICSLMLIIKWKSYYDYYFIIGYSYDSPTIIFNLLRNGAAYGIGYLYSKFALFFAGCCVLAGRDCFNKDVLMAIWALVAFPLITIFTHSNYHGVYNVSIIFIIILFVTLVPRRPQSLFKQTGSIALLVIVILLSVKQFTITTIWTKALVDKSSAWRGLYEKITNILESQPLPHNYSFLFDERADLFTSHLVFNRKITPKDIKKIGFMSVHDTAYKYANHLDYSRVITQQLAQNNLQILESVPNVIVFAYCDPTAVEKSPAFGPDGKKIAIPVTSIQTDYLLNSPHWKIISKLNSPLGCIYAYRYSKPKLTAAEKWKDIVEKIDA